jgi:hypothetical protein
MYRSKQMGRGIGSFFQVGSGRKVIPVVQVSPTKAAEANAIDAGLTIASKAVQGEKDKQSGKPLKQKKIPTPNAKKRKATDVPNAKKRKVKENVPKKAAIRSIFG